MKYPKIYMSVDNCFASKRWTKPCDWLSVVNKCGVRHIESSADTECDMLYSDRAYLDEWTETVRQESKRSGIKIASVYTGHGTYTTLGLTHTDKRCRNRMLCKWLYSHIDNAAKLDAIAGFYCHAFDDTVLQNPDTYSVYQDILYSQIKRAAEYAAEKKVLLSLEQMYSPQQYPWRIKDARDLICKVSHGKTPLYITIDTGHQYGQQLFLKPSEEDIIRAVEEKIPLYVGPEKCHSVLVAAQNKKIKAKEAAEIILDICSNYSYMFSEKRDSDTWAWLRELGRYSPLIHLQQTDNTSSSHKDFSPQNNRSGCITGERLLRALYESYSSPVDPDMPTPADKIYLTLELFYSNVTNGYDIIDSLKTSAEYWRRFIPEDGMTLDELVKML